jgi:hypothetical protein
MSRSEWEYIESDDTQELLGVESDDEHEHIITFNLNSTSDQGIPAAKQATTSNFRTNSVHHPHEFAIAASTIYTPGDGEARRLRIVTRPSQATVGKPHAKTDRWL